MMNVEGSHPEYFDELCALAAGGQISEAEFIELQDHMEQCTRCRSAYADFVDLLHGKLPMIDPGINGPGVPARFFSHHSSYRERFLARARKQGLAISQPRSRNIFRSQLQTPWWPALRYTQAARLAICLLLAVIVVLAYNLHQSDGRVKLLAAEVAAFSARMSPPLSPTSPQSHERQPAVRFDPETNAAATTVSPAKPASDGELDKARQDYAAAEARSKDLEARLQSAASEMDILREQYIDASDSRNQLQAKLADAEQALNRTASDLQRIRQGRSEDAAALVAKNLEIRALSEKLAAQTEILEREKTLLAASRDIHDLMGARNLHIVDVLDVDSKGKDRRAFGRVFYTEGKSLIFYAFDLADGSTRKRNASFQVWGTRGPAQTPAQNMGVFYVDDQKQNRWVLKFEDPRILAEIDSVFVTIEPQGGSDRPTGRKFLYAYLNANPNHP
jgi:hypothetical protein